LPTGAMQADNVNAELNTEAAASFDAFEKSWVGVVSDTEKHIQDQVGDTAGLHAIASADFPEDQLQDPEAKIFGCEPDFNAYKLDVNVLPTDAIDLPLRTAGGHIHVGINKADQSQAPLLDELFNIRATQALDLFVGLVFTWLDQAPDAIRRRELYGKASAHRQKPYGFEYRALSNTWAKTRELALMTYNLTQAGVRFALEAPNADPTRLDLVNIIGADTIQETINSGNANDAHAIFNNHIAELAEQFSPGINAMVQQAESNTTDERRVIFGWK